MQDFFEDDKGNIHDLVKTSSEWVKINFIREEARTEKASLFLVETPDGNEKLIWVPISQMHLPIKTEPDGTGEVVMKLWLATKLGLTIGIP